MNAKETRIRGQIERITYTNEETGYTIARVLAAKGERITCVGALAKPTAGEILEMTGEWVRHPRFGEQFAVRFYESVVPATARGIEKYLGSGLIKGIGPKMAKRIVKVFGEKTLDIIEEEPDRLSEVAGIGASRIAMIQKAWEEQKEIRKVMIFLQTHGVSANYAAKIYKAYGNDAIHIVQQNPYRLAYDIRGIGFVTADAIAQKLGFGLESPLRCEAGILYVLYTLTEEGHVFYPLDLLIEKASDLLKIENRQNLSEAVQRLVKEERVRLEDLVWNGRSISAAYLQGYYLAEANSARRLVRLLSSPPLLSSVNAEYEIGLAEKKTGMHLAEKQKMAVRAALSQKIVVITGGPGTGKSTLLNVVLEILGRVTDKIALAAPTGRAAKRMTEVTGYPAKTIHRLLCYDMRKGGFKKNEDDPLDCDLLVIDEASMVDQLLLNHLVKAIPSHAKCLFVGDINQLPSVGAGAVLRDLIRSRIVPVVFLREIFRQARQSNIVMNAHDIIEGRRVFFGNRENDDMFFIGEEDPEKTVEIIIGLVKTRLPRKYGYHPVNDIQVLSPMNRGVVGTMNLNSALQEALNPFGAQVARGSSVFRVNDKVMQIKNNYDKDVFNGDIGVITSIDAEEQIVFVDMDGRSIPYDFGDLDELVLAYAISIHKSQGAEYPVVIIPVTTQHYVMLQRNLLYTGVTRGKKLVVLVGTQKALNIAIRNTRQTARYTALSLRMQEEAQKKESVSSIQSEAKRQYRP